MEKQHNTHTSCHMNNYLARQHNVVQGSHSQLGLLVGELDNVTKLLLLLSLSVSLSLSLILSLQRGDSLKLIITTTILNRLSTCFPFFFLPIPYPHSLALEVIESPTFSTHARPSLKKKQRVKLQQESSPATKQLSRKETGSCSFTAELPFSAVTTTALAKPSRSQYDEAFNDAASRYNEYCQIIMVEDSDMQEAILQSSTNNSNEDR